MHSRKTITIITSPPTPGKPLPGTGNRISPTAKQTAPLYRIEERSRTVYVASDMDPADWDTHSLNALFTLAEGPEGGGEESSNEQPIHRTRSHGGDKQFVITEDGNLTDRAREQPSRVSVYRSRRPGVKKPSAAQTSDSNKSSPDTPRRISPSHSTPRERILFYHKHDHHYGFTNFSAHPVIYDGKKYPTSEHLFQSFKFHGHRPLLAEHIRTCSERPSVAFSEARRFQPEVRGDWKRVNIDKMDEALFHKFTQHGDLQAELLATGNAELIEASDKDAFWGWGADTRGRNELGKSLERLRTKLRGSAV